MTNHGTEAALPQVEDDKQAATPTITLELIDDKEDSDVHQSTTLTMKSGDAFLITDLCGNIPASRQEMGLFWHGTRYLHSCNLFLQGHHLKALSHHAAEYGNACQIDLTNYTFSDQEGHEVRQGEIHIHRELEVRHQCFVQKLTITSFHDTQLSLTLGLKVGADFRDLFEVRGAVRTQRGNYLPVQHTQDHITFAYRGLDEVERQSKLQLQPPAHTIHEERLYWNVCLQRNVPVEIILTATLNESQQQVEPALPEQHSWQALPQPLVQTNDVLFNRLLTRGLNDLMMLSTLTPHGYYPYAGIPWFSCPFGRDALITSLEFLPWHPEVVQGTLNFLAAHQGQILDEFTDAEPGKMLHEYRTGEMANLREVPFIPYYGSIDVTPLFLVTLDEYIRWSNNLEFLRTIWPQALAAAHWLITYGDRDGDSFIEYHKESSHGLANQGWKDSWDAISHADGSIARSPIALCEVQGYAYAAYRATSHLAALLGNDQEAAFWEQHAVTLQHNFLRDFWWEEEQVFYLALDANKQPCKVVSSDAGQCLWSGIVPEPQARLVIERLMREDMHSGWGIRTLSSVAARYNPMSYHNGSIWPHDTALVGAGFARYGGKAEAGRLLKDLYEASRFFEGARLPELYCGFKRREGYGPTRYPVACSPQAWATGAPFTLLNGLLGLQPDASRNTLTLIQPTLPAWLQQLELQGLRLGMANIHLRFLRLDDHTEVITEADNEVIVHIVGQENTLSL